MVCFQLFDSQCLMIKEQSSSVWRKRQASSMNNRNKNQSRLDETTALEILKWNTNWRKRHGELSVHTCRSTDVHRLSKHASCQKAWRRHTMAFPLLCLVAHAADTTLRGNGQSLAEATLMTWWVLIITESLFLRPGYATLIHRDWCCFASLLD